MIANRIESARKAAKQGIDAIVFNHRHLTMRRQHPTDGPTKLQRNALMTETYAQNRNTRPANHISGNAEIARDRRMPRPRRNHNGIEVPRLNRRPIRFIIANDGWQLTRQCSGGVRKIPGEGVVVIDNQEPQHDFVEAVRRVLPGPR